MLYLAEFYLPQDVDLADVASRARAAADLAAGAGAAVCFVQAIFVPQDESCFALYRADSELQVTAVGWQAGLTFDRVVPALSLPAGGPPADG